MNFKPGLLPRTATAKRHPLLMSPSGYKPPLHIDRRPELLTASNQGESPKCVGYGLAGWREYYRWKYDGIMEQIDPSPIYDRAKQIDNYPNEDGTSLEAGLQAAQDLGIMSAVAQESIREVTTAFDVKQALHRYGVVLAAFQATDEWSNPDAGGWMKPGGQKLGGHCVLLCGYSDVEVPNYFALQNSWGEEIGWRGFVRMSPEQFQQEFEYGLTWEFK